MHPRDQLRDQLYEILEPANEALTALNQGKSIEEVLNILHPIKGAVYAILGSS
jgi:hypothetical protein